MAETYLTRAGHAKLQEDLKALMKQKTQLSLDIGEAREKGDLKENAEYHAAREQQGFIEGRIQELDAALSFADVIDISKLNAGSRIVFGATVDLLEEGAEKEVTYQIVGDLEADIKRSLISLSSPFARAMIGKHDGDTVKFQAPSGLKTYEIVGVRYEG